MLPEEMSPKGSYNVGIEWEKCEPKPISLNTKLIPYTVLAFPVEQQNYEEVIFNIKQVI